jgi:putative phage-type endonuclease
LDEVDDWFQQNRIRLWHASFEKEVVADVSNYLFGEWSEDDYCEEYDLPEIREWVKRVVAYYFAAEIHMPQRQGGDQIPLSPLRKLIIANKLRILDAAPSSTQKTQEWYETRYGLLTASNAWKALGTEAQQNQLIMEKCTPFDKFKEDCARHGNLSADNPMAWGQKYEPVTAMIYEAKNRTKLGEYGCIVHSKWRFLGASPDGINVDPASPLYGRMVEIKNIVNRDIDGVPLDAYWVQMQIQMEVCDLDECDFVETRIKKFANLDEFLSSDNPLRGVVLTFVPRIQIGTAMKQQEHSFEKKQFHEYFLLSDSVVDSTVEKWVQDKRTEHSTYAMSNCEYWCVDQYSCVLVKRNRAWFDAAIPKIAQVWQIIQSERVTGCEHRVPKKREPKQSSSVTVTVNKL